MKKLLTLSLVLTFGLSICGCGAAGSNASTAATEPSTTAAPETTESTDAETTPESSEEQASDTIEIGTAQELVDFAKSVTDGSISGAAGMTVLLTADIDCKDVEWTPIGTMDLEDMSNYSCMFQGVFDGQGHTISNVTFDSDYPVCGVGIIGMNLGEVKNLTAENIQIHCTDTYSMAIGGVVGYNMGEIHDVKLTGENEIAGVNATGGRNAGELLQKYPKAKVTAVDYSPLSVEKSQEYNKDMIAAGRCIMQQGDVSALQLPKAHFDLATAFETIYFWKDLEKCFAQVAGVLKDGGTFLIVNESDGTDKSSLQFEKIIDGMKCYTPQEIASALKTAGFSIVKTDHHPDKPWTTAIAKK